MNSTLDAGLIEDAYQEDPARAASEYGGQFRQDIEGFISQEIVDSCVIPGRYELPRVPNTVYHAFTDPSGGSSDSFTLAIAHQEGDRVILDCLRERRPPFSPDQVCAEYAQILQSYGLSSVSGDRYAGQWPVEGFAKYGIGYRASELPKNDLYLSMLPMLTTGKAELLDSPRLVTQLCGLERRTARSGRDSIDHGPHQHDDICNSVAGALVAANKQTMIDPGEWEWGSPYEYDPLASPSELVSDGKFVSLLDF